MVGFILFIALITTVFAYAFDLNFGIVGLALIFSGATSFASYWFSDSIVLALSGASPANRDAHFDFFTTAENLAMSQRMPLPRLYVIEDSAPNAFATGRDPQHAVVCATTGLLQKLNRSELEAVVAHELAHVQNYDIRLMSIVTILVGMVVFLSDFLLRSTIYSRGKREGNSQQLQLILLVVGVVLALLSPIIAQLIQLAVSRRREFLADATAVSMTKNPQGLINALQKLTTDPEPLEAANNATAHLYIVSPLKGGHAAKSLFSSLFSTHPPLQDRITALQKL